MRPSVLRFALIALSLTAATGCHRKTKPIVAPAPIDIVVDTPATRTVTPIDASADSASRRAQFVADSIAAARRTAAADSAAAAQAELVNALRAPVHFDYDQDLLREEAKAILNAKAAILAANPSVRLVITGHTDERGTAEYNLALGQRRAAQVKRYLVSMGIDVARLTTQSLGDSQPAASGTDEASYQQNRRAEFQPTGAAQ